MYVHEVLIYKCLYEWVFVHMHRETKSNAGLYLYINIYYITVVKNAKFSFP